MENSNIKKKNNKNIGLIIGGVLFFIIVLFSFGIYQLTKLPPRSTAFKNIVSASENNIGLHVENNKNVSSIYYRVVDADNTGSATEEYFNIDISQTQLGDIKQGLESPFFSCADRSGHKIVYIILDISGSVVDKIGAEYFKQVVSTIHTILSNDVLNPGDQIRIRFMGSNKDSVDSVDFTGPSFTYDISKNDVQKKNILNLKGYSDVPLTKCQNNESVVSLQGLTEKISSEYNKRKETPDSESNISGLLERISSEVSLEKNRFSSVRYIIFTDGESTDGFAGCDSLSADQCGVNLKELNMNKNLDNKTYVIWVKNSEFQNAFRKLFDGISINFQ